MILKTYWLFYIKDKLEENKEYKSAIINKNKLNIEVILTPNLNYYLTKIYKEGFYI